VTVGGNLSVMSTRRFNEAEVAAIFERATEVQPTGQRQASSVEGMTLAELQEIGREVGIPAESIALAAQSVDQSGLPTSRTFLGLPLGVARTVNLERKLSDDEWEQFVVDLRETFNARGVVRSQGSLRQWTNGNLQALLEPTATGNRIRLRTIKGDALAMLGGGLGLVGLSVILWSLAVVQGTLGDRGTLLGLASVGILGAAMFVTSALRLPSWARTRQRQMEEVAARIALATTTSPPRSD
jgi:hypothetical protein